LLLEGTVVNGAIVFDEPAVLPNGTRVVVEVKAPAKAAASPLGEMLLRHAGKAQGRKVPARGTHADGPG
jgi:hypothetical protein